MWYTCTISYSSQGTLLWIGTESSVCALLCHDWYFTSSLRFFSRDGVNDITHNIKTAHLVSASGLNFWVFYNAAVVKGQRRHALWLVRQCSEQHSYDQGDAEQLVSSYVVNTNP